MSCTVEQKRRILESQDYKYTLDQWRQLDAIIKLHKDIMVAMKEKRKGKRSV
jgi:hypothetical protein